MLSPNSSFRLRSRWFLYALAAPLLTSGCFITIEDLAQEDSMNGSGGGSDVDGSGGDPAAVGGVGGMVGGGSGGNGGMGGGDSPAGGGTGGGEFEPRWRCEVEGDALFFDDFENGESCWEQLVPGSFQRRDDILRQDQGSWVFEQRELEELPRIALATGPDEGYGDVEIAVRVRILEWGSTQSADDIVGVFARYQSANDFYYVGLLGNDKAHLRRRVGGSNSSIGSSVPIDLGWQTGRYYHLVLRIEGSTLSFSVDGETFHEEEDSELVGLGRVGIGSFSNARVRFDNVEITPL